MVLYYMANMMHHRKPQHVNYLNGIGQKVKQLVEIGAGLKGAYETGKTLYSLASAASPYVLPLLGAL
jgi:hypothetical protein